LSQEVFCPLPAGNIGDERQKGPGGHGRIPIQKSEGDIPPEGKTIRPQKPHIGPAGSVHLQEGLPELVPSLTRAGSGKVKNGLLPQPFLRQARHGFPGGVAGKEPALSVEDGDTRGGIVEDGPETGFSSPDLLLPLLSGEKDASQNNEEDKGPHKQVSLGSQTPEGSIHLVSGRGHDDGEAFSSHPEGIPGHKESPAGFPAGQLQAALSRHGPGNETTDALQFRGPLHEAPFGPARGRAAEPHKGTVLGKHQGDALLSPGHGDDIPGKEGREINHGEEHPPKGASGHEPVGKKGHLPLGRHFHGS